MRRPAITVLASSFAVVLALGCGGKQPLVSSVDRSSPKFAATSFINEGSISRVVVDVRAARIGDASEFMPLMLAVENKTETFWTISRENIVLELPDRTTLPLATFREFNDDYTRARQDLRMAEPFVATLNSVFPQSLFDWLPLDFYPEKSSGVFPRDSVEIRRGQLALGYVYFRMPHAPIEDAGRYKLIVSPAGAGERLVVDFHPFQETR
ncbi:MAG: hypothetical protein GY716_01775 [bacterium]|nr:hypothetical protein [bacterium]